jgi:hypothetical protein
MTERSPEFRGKYASTRDVMLHLMATEMWAHASSGEKTAPTGWFARMSNSSLELEEIPGLR